ncbi:MAG: zinc-ribbon domain-containing protein, partial [Dehalococcoidia bacterium]
MKCPKCQFENRSDVSFCEECGAKLELACPSCAAAIPLGRKFCGKCGHDLTTSREKPQVDLSFEEKLEQIQRYLPDGLTEKIL